MHSIEHIKASSKELSLFSCYALFCHIQHVHCTCTCIYIGPRQELNQLQKRFEAGDWKPSFCSEAADDEIHVDDTCAAATTSLPVTTMEESNTKGTCTYIHVYTILTQSTCHTSSNIMSGNTVLCPQVNRESMCGGKKMLDQQRRGGKKMLEQQRRERLLQVYTCTCTCICTYIYMCIMITMVKYSISCKK